MRRPVIYGRKSRVFADKAMISPEMQTAEASALCHRYGEADPQVIIDLNMSGRRRDRPGFLELLRLIEGDEVSAVYAYSLSRLSRSMGDIVALADLCRDHGVPIHLVRDQDPDPTTASGRMTLNLLASVAQFEADVARERARDTVEARRARGDKLGPRFYGTREGEDVGAVVAAYRETRSFIGCARSLNSQGIPARNGKHWSPTSAAIVLRRVAPELLPVARERGVSHAAPFLFTRLLRCHCGHLLTGRRDRHYVAYYCSNARNFADHGRVCVRESVVLDWVKGEMAKVRDVRVPMGGSTLSDEERTALLDRRGRLNRAAARARSEEEEQGYVEEIEAIDSELRKADEAGTLVKLAVVRWDAPAEVVNDYLRSLWESVDLGPGMLPVQAIPRPTGVLPPMPAFSPLPAPVAALTA